MSKRRNYKYIELHISSPVYGNHSVLIDYDDFVNLKGEISIKKDVSYKTDTYYAYIGKHRLSRFIMNCPKGKVVDHINHNTLDNRRCNLRICTQEENNKNKIYKKKFDYEHIYWHSRDKAFDIIYIKNNNRNFIGRYKTIEEAIKARDDYLIKLK